MSTCEHDRQDDVCWECKDTRIAALERELASYMAESVTWGELPEVVRSMIVSHEWDNKTPSEQRNWAVNQLAATQTKLAEVEVLREGE